MMKKMASVSLLSVLCLAVTACGGGNNNGNAAGTTPPANTPSASAPAANEPVKNEKLIVYTNANSDGRGEWLIEKAEKNNPVADVVFGLNNMLYENLKKENVLTKYVPKWAGEVEPGLNDPEGFYHGLVKQAILLGYNPKNFTAETAPKDWTDLYKNAALKGKYEAPTLLGQITPQLVVAGILTRYQDPKGELGISKQGWDEVKQLFDNGVRAVEGEDFYANLASGKTPLGAVVSGTLSKKEEQYKVKAGIVSPQIGVPMIVEHVAIINGTKKKATAERFAEWIGTSEVQGEFAAKFNSMPANTKAVAKANEPVKALYATLKAQPLDWGFIANNIGKWVEKIELQIMK
jgi:iron(III) transport system substrate-binding protein